MGAFSVFTGALTYLLHPFSRSGHSNPETDSVGAVPFVMYILNTTTHAAALCPTSTSLAFQSSALTRRTEWRVMRLQGTWGGGLVIGDGRLVSALARQDQGHLSWAFGMYLLRQKSCLDAEENP